MPLPPPLGSLPGKSDARPLPFSGSQPEGGGGFISSNSSHLGSISQMATGRTKGTLSNLSISTSASNQQQDRLDDARYAYGARLRKANEEEDKDDDLGFGSALLQGGNFRRSFVEFMRKNRTARHLSDEEKAKLREIIIRRSRVKRPGDEEFSLKDKRAMHEKAQQAKNKGEISDSGFKHMKIIINQL